MDKFYKIFASNEEVIAPYSEVRTLSNGEKVGKYIGTKIEGSLTNEEVVIYISENHVEQVDGI